MYGYRPSGEIGVGLPGLTRVLGLCFCVSMKSKQRTCDGKEIEDPPHRNFAEVVGVAREGPESRLDKARRVGRVLPEENKQG